MNIIVTLKPPAGVRDYKQLLSCLLGALAVWLKLKQKGSDKTPQVLDLTILLMQLIMDSVFVFSEKTSS